MSGVKRRAYRSRRRQESADDTRRRIIDSARRLFVDKGYGATTIEVIGHDAGVSPQTVYAAFGNKRGLLFALLDEMATGANVAGLAAKVQAEQGRPRAQLKARVAFNVRFYARSLALIDLARTVSGVEPDLGAMWTEGEARRHRAESALVRRWAADGALRPGVSTRQATDIWWALSGPDVYRLFVVERGWSKRRFETWLLERLEAELFGAG